MTTELREKIRQSNANHEEADLYLAARNCHLCQHAIVTNGSPAISKVVGQIGEDFDIRTIQWKGGR